LTLNISSQTFKNVSAKFCSHLTQEAKNAPTFFASEKTENNTTKKKKSGKIERAIEVDEFKMKRKISCFILGFCIG